MYILLITLFLIIIGIISIILWGPEIIPFYNIYAVNKNGNFEKGQWVRLLDIFVLAPMGLYLGYILEKSGEFGLFPYFIYSYSIGTAVYNFGNYWKNIIE